MASGPPDRRDNTGRPDNADRADSADRNPELNRDMLDRKTGGDLSARLNELPGSHPSSADYGRASADHDSAASSDTAVLTTTVPQTRC